MSAERSSLLKLIKREWEKLKNCPDVFAYRLGRRDHRYLAGSHSFYAEYNPLRVTKRRAPQMIDSVNPRFNEQAFNFKKIQAREVLVSLESAPEQVTFIVNRSPLTEYHTLICPQLEKGLPQKVTREALHFCISWLLAARADDGANEDYKAFRIGYNSPGALASVNHLHLHLMYLPNDLYVDSVELEPLASCGKDIYRFAAHMPTQGICFIFYNKEGGRNFERKLDKLMAFLMWLCDQQLPHNIFMAHNRGNAAAVEGETLKVFIFARTEFKIVKDVAEINVGFCELSGFVPVGDRQRFEALEENEVIEMINQETVSAYPRIYEYLRTFAAAAS